MMSYDSPISNMFSGKNHWIKRWKTGNALAEQHYDNSRENFGQTLCRIVLQNIYPQVDVV